MFKRILCPTDFSETSFKALEAAVKLDPSGAAELCLLHVEPDYQQMITVGTMPAQQAARQRAEAVRNLCAVAEERTPSHVRTNTLLSQGDAATEILKAAREQQSDLVVLTAHGGGRSPEGIGVVAQAVLLNATCPVLVVNVPRPEPRISDLLTSELGDGNSLRPEFEVVHSGRHALYLDGD